MVRIYAAVIAGAALIGATAMIGAKDHYPRRGPVEGETRPRSSSLLEQMSMLESVRIFKRPYFWCMVRGAQLQWTGGLYVVCSSVQGTVCVHGCAVLHGVWCGVLCAEIGCVCAVYLLRVLVWGGGVGGCMHAVPCRVAGM